MRKSVHLAPREPQGSRASLSTLATPRTGERFRRQGITPPIERLDEGRVWRGWKHHGWSPGACAPGGTCMVHVASLPQLQLHVATYRSSKMTLNISRQGHS